MARVLQRLALALACAAFLGTVTSPVLASERLDDPPSTISTYLGSRIGVNGTDSGGDLLLPGVTVTLQENVTRRPLFLEGRVPADAIAVVDDLSGRPVPLTGAKAAYEGGRTRVLLPQLPAGTFTVTFPAGQAHIMVGDRTVAGMVPSTGANSPLVWCFALGVVCFGVVVAITRSRRGFVFGVLAGGAAATAACLGALLALPQPASAQDCTDDSCRVAAFVTVFDDGGAPALSAALNAFPGTQCHQVAHEVGYVLWRRDPDADAVADRMVFGCDEGVPHGTVEAMAAFSSDADFPQLLDRLCRAPADERIVATCFHAGGHATIWRTNGDLAAAYALCDNVDSPAGPYECHGSAVMEWADRWESASRAGTPSLVAPQLDQPMNVCLEGPRDPLFRAGCYLGTNHRNASPEEAAAWCLEREEFVVSCFSALGENLPYFSANLHPEQEMDPDNNPLRVIDALAHVELCHRAPSAEGQDICARQVARIFSWLRRAPSEAEELCRTYPQSFRPACTDEVARAFDEMSQLGVATVS